MTTLLNVEDVPAAVLERIRQRADVNRRSLPQEVVAILSEAATPAKAEPSREEYLPTRVDQDALENEFGPPYLTTVVNLPDPSPGKPVAARKGGPVPFELCCELEDESNGVPIAPQE